MLLENIKESCEHIDSMCLDWLDDFDSKNFLKVSKFHIKLLTGLQFL